MQSECGIQGDKKSLETLFIYYFYWLTSHIGIQLYRSNAKVIDQSIHLNYYTNWAYFGNLNNINFIPGPLDD